MHKVTKLRCEYLNNPIGIDIDKPRLYWQNKSDDYCFTQSAYQILAYHHEDLENPVWDSGKVVSDESIHIPYEGKTLKSRDRIYWQVKTWDSQDVESEHSDLAFFEMGLLNMEDWVSKWIDPEKEIDINVQQPVSYIRKEFNIQSEVKSARLYITSCGLYEASINGKKAGDEVLTPGCTDYDLHQQYQTYDITSYIKQGDNAFGVLLADGWYRGTIGIDGHRNVYGERKLLLCQLEIITDDGEVIIGSDETFKASNDGKIRIADIFDGEWVDASKSLKDFDIPGFDDNNWQSVKTEDYTFKTLCASNSVPIREKEQFKPTLLKTPDGSTVLDFGQNIAGYISFSIEGNKGHTIDMYFGETLDENGNFTQDNIKLERKKNPQFQEMHYTLCGEGREYYKARFFIHGFRYVKVDHWCENFKPEDFTAYALYSDMEPNGEFTCSNQLVNRLVENVIWSQKSNFVDIPTDCPTREKQGWNGDAQIFVNAGSRLFNTGTFYKKWLKDYFGTQEESGLLYNITPRVVKEPRKAVQGCAGWVDAAIIIPYNLWNIYGDKRILEDFYTGMKKLVDYESKKAKKNSFFAFPNTSLTKKIKNYKLMKYVWNTGYQWGEWLEPGVNEIDMKDRMKKLLSGYYGEVATAYYYYSSYTLSKIASILGYKEDEEKYLNLANNIKKAYQVFYTDDGDIKRTERQAQYVRPLMFDLLPDSKRQKAADELAQVIKENDYKIGTGFLSTGFLCEVLTRYGYKDVAFKVITQNKAPGWIYEVEHGATTIWETWESVTEDGRVSASHNHYSSGAVLDWFFGGIAGINSLAGGYKTFEIKPNVGQEFTYASAKHQSLYGEIESKWEKKDESIIYTIQVPANTEASVSLESSNIKILRGEEFVRKEKDRMILGSGKYVFETK